MYEALREGLDRMKYVTRTKKVNFGMVIVLYLFGIFMDAIDTGIVTPARNYHTKQPRCR
jgi:hypothetical protein